MSMCKFLENACLELLKFDEFLTIHKSLIEHVSASCEILLSQIPLLFVECFEGQFEVSFSTVSEPYFSKNPRMLWGRTLSGTGDYNLLHKLQSHPSRTSKNAGISRPEGGSHKIDGELFSILEGDPHGSLSSTSGFTIETRLEPGFEGSFNIRTSLFPLC